MVSVNQNATPHRPLLVQAPVRALDPHGLTVVTVGTIAFAASAVLCWAYLPHLAATGRGWYLAVALTGTGLGLGGLAFGIWRARRKPLPRPAEVSEQPSDSPQP